MPNDIWGVDSVFEPSLLRLGEELLLRGHDVRFATHDTLRSQVVESGATFVSTGSYPIEIAELRSQIEAMKATLAQFKRARTADVGGSCSSGGM